MGNTNLRTLREIQLVRADLKRQLKNDENLIRYQTVDLFSEVKTTVANIALMRSLAYIVGYFVGKKMNK